MSYQAGFKTFPEGRQMEDGQGFGYGQSNQRGQAYGDSSPKPIEVLMVAEKPSIARTIAEYLGGGKYLTRRGEVS